VARKSFFNKLQSAEHIFFGMWLSDRFEFETPALNEQFVKILFAPALKKVFAVHEEERNTFLPSYWNI
jgi:hypothetical protein